MLSTESCQKCSLKGDGPLFLQLNSKGSEIQVAAGIGTNRLTTLRMYAINLNSKTI